MSNKTVFCCRTIFQLHLFQFLLKFKCLILAISSIFLKYHFSQKMNLLNIIAHFWPILNKFFLGPFRNYNLASMWVIFMIIMIKYQWKYFKKSTSKSCTIANKDLRQSNYFSEKNIIIFWGHHIFFQKFCPPLHHNIKENKNSHQLLKKIRLLLISFFPSRYLI